MTEAFFAWAKANGWHIEPADSEAVLPEEIVQRYAIPSVWLDFIRHFRLCSDPSDTKWFLTIEDYYPKETGFQWNDYELQSLEAAEADPRCAAQWKEQIRTYWDKYFPIVMDVAGEYAYFAIDTESGEVVRGCEPEFEECDAVADSFGAFLNKIMEGESL